MSNVAAALMNYLVIIFSYLLGFKFPIEWLLTIIITVAPSSSAFSTPIEHRQPSRGILSLLKKLLSTKPLERLKYEIQNSS